ncbi:MAG: carboxypeptidase regulatory-like domain-containing protein [Planctomycetes bacterium]|nr:carboxypeptidase regulatory-like domain-containing protein [Planctomycetota bacterium]
MRSKARLPVLVAALAVLVALHWPARGPRVGDAERGSEASSAVATGGAAAGDELGADTTPASVAGALEVLALRAADRTPIEELALALRLLDDDTFEPRLAYTDRQGLVRFDDVPAGDVVVESAVGGELHALVRSKKCGRRTLLVARGVDVRGRVLSPTGLPLAGATLVLARETELDDLRHAWPVAISDPFGRFALPDVAPGARRLVARHPRFAPSAAYALTSEPGCARELDVVLGGPAAELRGRVLDEFGKLLPAVRVTVGPLEPSGARESDSSTNGERPVTALATHTDERGEFVLRGLPIGASWIEARAEGFVAACAQRTLAPGANERLELVLPRGARLAGGARLSHGAPARHANVRASVAGGDERITRAALDGSFVLDSLPPGVVHVVIDWQGEQWAETELELGREGARFDATLEPVRALAGSVVDARGEPLADATVWLALTSGGDHPRARIARTAADGRFRFAGLVERDHELRVFADAEQLCELARRERVRPGADALAIVVDAKRLPTARIVGRVLGPDARGLAGAEVRARRAGLELVPCETDEDGAFELGPLAPGAWWLCVEPPKVSRIGLADGASVADAQHDRSSAELAPRAFAIAELAPGEVRDTGDLALERGARLRVRCGPEPQHECGPEPQHECGPEPQHECGPELELESGLDVPRAADAALGAPVIVARSFDGLFVEWLDFEGGVARSRPLPPGRWRVALEAGAGLALQAQEVELGEADVELAFELLRGREVALRFDDDVHEVLVGAAGGRVLLERELGVSRELELVLAPERYRLELRASDGRTRSLDFEITRSSPRRVFDVKME